MVKRKRNARGRRKFPRRNYRGRRYNKRRRLNGRRVRRVIRKYKIERRLKAKFVPTQFMVPEATLQWNAWRFYSTPTAATAVLTYSQQVYNLASVWDPWVQDQTGTVLGNTVQNWIQMASLYQNYIVKKCRYHLYFFPQSTTTTIGVRPARVWYWIDNNPTLPTDAYIPGIPKVKFKWVPVNTGTGGINYNRPISIKKLVNISKYLPSPQKEEEDKARTDSTGVTNSPARSVYLHVAYQNTDDTATVRFGWAMDMWFQTKWFNQVTKYLPLNDTTGTSNAPNPYPFTTALVPGS